MWITVDKIQGYVGLLHGNLWVYCTATYGFTARLQTQKTNNIINLRGIFKGLTYL